MDEEQDAGEFVISVRRDPSYQRLFVDNVVVTSLGNGMIDLALIVDAQGIASIRHKENSTSIDMEGDLEHVELARLRMRYAAAVSMAGNALGALLGAKKMDGKGLEVFVERLKMEFLNQEDITQ